METGMQVQMLGWSNNAHNGLYTVTRTGDKTFTYLAGTNATSTGGTCGSILSPTTVRNSTSSQPTAFSLNCYLEDIVFDDYFEIYVTTAQNGDIIVLSDLAWLFNTV